VTVGDGLLKHGFRPHLDDFLADRPDALALVPRPRADHDGHADGGGGSSGPGRSASPLGTTEGAAFLLGTDFVRLVDRPGFSDAAGLRTTDVLHRLAENGHGVRVREVEGWWKRSFEAQDLLEATRLLLEGLATQVSPSQAERATIQGGVHVHPTATLDSVVLRGPVLIGPHAHVSDSYVGPYTSIGAGAVVEGAEIEHSIVQREASIQHVGGRLEACVIGRRAAVRRSFSLPTALHLNIGDGAEVVLT
jgi:glucose-1-phosphate thymidylyltransferase